MNTLRQAVAEYLTMRRNLGFQLREAGKALLDFVTFMGNYSHPYKNSLLKQHYMIDFRHTNTPLSNETERSRFTTN